MVKDIVKARNLIGLVRKRNRNDKDFIDLANLYIEIFDNVIQKYGRNITTYIDKDDILQIYYIDLLNEVNKKSLQIHLNYLID